MNAKPKSHAAEIRRLVDAGGWNAVRLHPVYGPIWERHLRDQKSTTEVSCLIAESNPRLHP